MSQQCGTGVVAEQQWSITNKSSVAAAEQKHKQQRTSSGGGREGVVVEEGKSSSRARAFLCLFLVSSQIFDKRVRHVLLPVRIS